MFNYTFSNDGRAVVVVGIAFVVPHFQEGRFKEYNREPKITFSIYKRETRYNFWIDDSIEF